MVDFKRVDAKDNPQKEIEDVVGAQNLSDMLRALGVIRGTFALNGHEFRDFEARSPAEVARKIDEAHPHTGVRAELDDEFRLVLSSRSEIKIASGSAFDEQRQRDAEAQADRDHGLSDEESKRRRESERKRRSDYDDILELLGLDANAEHAYGTAQSEWLPGRSAEDRKKARESGNEPGSEKDRVPLGPYGTNDPGLHQKRAEDAAKVGGGMTGFNTGPSNTTAKDPHTAPEAGPYGKTDPKQEGLAPAQAPAEHAKQGEPYVPGQRF